ncbi:unnamed protein product [Trifolium pratense]|uniref:Uncharacterized protein n=1 Tax=Trifolium pratense TaxID=57577 RepID=A0ACB0K3W8_TRIPR|nr:unnamed protein product [Trifolium pratense]
MEEQNEEHEKRELYAVLNLSPEASDEEIRKAYRQWAQAYHPDNCMVKMFGIRGMDSGERTLYPINIMHQNPRIRMSFIRKVYSIVAFQLLLTVVVASVLIFVPPVANFFNNYIPNYVLYIVIIFALFLVEYYHQKHPLNYFLLVIFTVSLALPVGLFCVLAGGKMILEAVMLTIMVIVNLTLYTFWAAKRGYDFNFLYQLLYLWVGALLVIILFIPIQMLFLLGKLSCMIFGCLPFIIFCGYIVYEIDTLIKRISYAEYISASVSLYLDVINLFASLFLLYLVLLI